MTVADVPLGLRLKEQAGWNQMQADWLRLLALEPDGCFVGEWAGRPVGTVATCVFGPVAWVAMVLVDPSCRGRGLGRALLEHALAYLDRRGVAGVRLDATPLGQPLYEKLGFREEYRLDRYAGVLPAALGGPVDPVGPEDLDGVLALDRRVTGTDRAQLLRRLYAERPGAWWVVRRADAVIGYLADRPGSQAVQLGPCGATEDAGPLLLADAGWRLVGQQVFVDVPADHGPAVAWARSQGLAVQRSLVRMCRGEGPAEQRAELWASFGPEKG